MWWEHDIGWGAWLMMTVGMLGFWAAVALFVVLGLRVVGRPEEPSTDDQLDPRQILERRLAQGQISVDEFHVRLEAIGGSTAKGRQSAAAFGAPADRSS